MSWLISDAALVVYAVLAIAALLVIAIVLAVAYCAKHEEPLEDEYSALDQLPPSMRRTLEELPPLTPERRKHDNRMTGLSVFVGALGIAAAFTFP